MLMGFGTAADAAFCGFDAFIIEVASFFAAAASFHAAVAALFSSIVVLSASRAACSLLFVCYLFISVSPLYIFI